MTLIEILRSILLNTKENKSKVFLTTLGIIVGALTIVLVIAIGNGSQASVAEQYKSLNVGTIQIFPAFGRGSTEKLSISDMEVIKEEAPSLKKVTIMIGGNGTVNYGNDSTSASIAGVTEDIKEINNLEMAYGTFINMEQNEEKEKVAVIGFDIAELFFEEDPSQAVGERITINGKRYDVIGVLKRMGDSSMRGFNPDEGVFVPYQVAEKSITGRNVRPTILGLAKDIDSVSQAIDEVNLVLQKEHKGKSDQFMILDAGSRLVSAQNSAKTMTMMLLSVAVVVLIVGGIGIMNVLFVSVKERTKEIGILKAIGAKKSDILLIFLLDAIIVSGIGGLVGILGSMAVMPALNYFQIRAIPSAFAYGLAFGFSVITGTFFGYYPASKAASLNPIDALNYE